MELLVVVALIGIIALIGIPIGITEIVKANIRGYNFRADALLKQSRLQAIRNGRPTLVLIDTTTRTITSFVDTDEDGAINPAVDRRIGSVLLPGSLSFRSPGAEPLVEGFEPDDGITGVIQFNMDGSIADPGFYRYGDDRGNFFEIEVGPSIATGKITIRKFAGGQFVAENEIRRLGPDVGGEMYEWAWY